MSTETQARHASLQDLADMLRTQQARKIDVVAPATKLWMEGGLLHIAGTDAQLDDDGVTATTGVYRPTAIFDEGLADKLRIPIPFLRRMRTDRVMLYDAMINGLLNGALRPGGCLSEHRVGDPDPRSFLLRCFRADNEDVGVARAFLSNKFKTIDHFDVLTACLQGVKAAGVPVQIADADLTDRRMVVRVIAPELSELAPALLRNYRSPFTGARGSENPTVFAGFEFSNSEVGEGKFSICPRLVFQICNNGAKITKDALSSVHLGGVMAEGVIEWSEDTVGKEVDLVIAKTADAVRTFLNIDYMQKVIASLTEQADSPVDATTVVQNVGKKLSFTEATIKGVLDHFIRGGDTSAGGVMQAITSYAHEVDDADLAYSLEGVAVQAMALAAS